MLKQLKGLAICLALLSGHAVAAGEPIKDSDIPTLNADEGRVGEVRRVDDGSEFKVCSDPDNMPYSNIRGEGFEDKIAEVIAKDLGFGRGTGISRSIAIGIARRKHICIRTHIHMCLNTHLKKAYI